ncbi:MAG: FAD:protein FMN transferase, partial [Bacteroidota bacterium]
INAFISFGGSSVLTRGHHPHGEFWPFSFREVGIKETWRLTNDALSISQTKADNEKHTHILNTLEEKNATGDQMACVQSNSATDAEVLTTALLAGPENMQNKIVAAFDIKKHRIYNIMP